MFTIMVANFKQKIFETFNIFQSQKHGETYKNTGVKELCARLASSIGPHWHARRNYETDTADGDEIFASTLAQKTSGRIFAKFLKLTANGFFF